MHRVHRSGYFWTFIHFTELYNDRRSKNDKNGKVRHTHLIYFFEYDEQEKKLWNGQEPLLQVLQFGFDF